LKGLKKIGWTEVRLFLAVILVGICFVGMEPSIFEENICKEITTDALTPGGEIYISNSTGYLASVKFTGTGRFDKMIYAAGYAQAAVDVGSYAWVAYFVGSDKKPQRGFVVVREDKTSLVSLN